MADSKSLLSPYKTFAITQEKNVQGYSRNFRIRILNICCVYSFESIFEAILMSTLNILLFIEDWKDTPKISPFASRPGAIINLSDSNYPCLEQFPWSKRYSSLESSTVFRTLYKKKKKIQKQKQKKTTTTTKKTSLSPDSIFSIIFSFLFKGIQSRSGASSVTQVWPIALHFIRCARSCSNGYNPNSTVFYLRHLSTVRNNLFIKYTVANFWRYPIRRRVAYASALELNFWVHYENTPIQIYRKFHLQKPKIFS